MSRPPARAARYEFLTFRSAPGGRAWLTGLIDKVGTARAVGSSVLDSRWVTVGFTWYGLRALGVAEASLATFPEEFRQGMAARADVLGVTGANHPDHWVGGLASPTLHAIVILFARDVAERERCRQEHERYLKQCEGVELLSSLDLEAIPPFDYAHEHFGYRDRLSQPVIEGTGVEPTPGSGPPIKPGEFFLGYPDEEGPAGGMPQPDILSRNGSYVAYLMIEEHVGRFRDFLREHGETLEQQEMIAAKLMGRWRSGAPLVLAGDKDDPNLGADHRRNNDFNYASMDPYGYACPLGAHIRRMNPRDTKLTRLTDVNLHRLIRRGTTYGPPYDKNALSEADDQVPHGAYFLFISAKAMDTIEFLQQEWINDGNFIGIGSERDPIIGRQEEGATFTIPRRPVRRLVHGIETFNVLRGGEYFFMPSISALNWLANLT